LSGWHGEDWDEVDDVQSFSSNSLTRCRRTDGKMSISNSRSGGGGVLHVVNSPVLGGETKGSIGSFGDGEGWGIHHGVCEPCALGFGIKGRTCCENFDLSRSCCD